MDIRFVLNVERVQPEYSVKSLCNGPLISHHDEQQCTSLGMHRCRWEGCQKIFASYETLFSHVGDFHVGRKRQGTLCLDCKWNGCAVKCTKRDHIMSHMKVHVPLKPFKCTSCPKAFKRGQDLTKHQRLHLGNFLALPNLRTFHVSGGYHSGNEAGYHYLSHNTNSWGRDFRLIEAER